MNTSFTQKAPLLNVHQLHYFKLIRFSVFTFILSLSSLSLSHSQCTGTGDIIASGPNSLGNPSLLDPNGDGFITSGGVAFTSGTTELAEFESLLSGNDCACETGWRKFAGNADEPDADIRTGGTCGNTDIVSDDDGGQDHAYYTIIDTDGDCNTTDDVMIVFRIRVADVSSGTFSFEVLVNNDVLIGEQDPDGIQCCNNAINPGFEKEIQLATGGGNAGVNVYDIDGFINGNNVSSEKSYDLDDNSQVSMACGTDSSCPAGAEPVFYTFFVPIDDLGFPNCVTALIDMSLAAVSSQSGNPVIAECNSTSDVGGIDDNVDNSVCGDMECPAGCSTCNLGEALVCAANSFLQSLPVDWTTFTARENKEDVDLFWETKSEENNTGFELERSTDAQNWTTIDFIPSQGEGGGQYAYTDKRTMPGYNYYRLKQIDLNGRYDYSEIRTVLMEATQSKFLEVFPNPNNGVFTLSLHNPEMQKAFIKLFDSTGNLIWQQDFRNEEIHVYWEKEFDLPQYEVYFLMTQVGDLVETRKVVVVDEK